MLGEDLEVLGGAGGVVVEGGVAGGPEADQDPEVMAGVVGGEAEPEAEADQEAEADIAIEDTVEVAAGVRGGGGVVDAKAVAEVGGEPEPEADQGAVADIAIGIEDPVGEVIGGVAGGGPEVITREADQGVKGGVGKAHTEAIEGIEAHPKVDVVIPGVHLQCML